MAGLAKPLSLQLGVAHDMPCKTVEIVNTILPSNLSCITLTNNPNIETVGAFSLITMYNYSQSNNITPYMFHIPLYIGLNMPQYQ